MPGYAAEGCRVAASPLGIGWAVKGKTGLQFIWEPEAHLTNGKEVCLMILN